MAQHLALRFVEAAIKIFKSIRGLLGSVAQAVFRIWVKPVGAPIFVGLVKAFADAAQLFGLELCCQARVGWLYKTQQSDEAGFHVLRHRAHLRRCDVVRGHGLHAFEQSHILGQLVLSVPTLQVGQCVVCEWLLAVLQIGVAVEPPVNEVVALVVDQFDRAAATYAHQRSQCQPDECLADNSSQ